MSVKIEEKIKVHHLNQKKNVDSLQERKSKTIKIGSTELEDAQVTLHPATVQLENLDSVINSLVNKETLARNLK